MKCPAEGCINEIEPELSFCSFHMQSLPKKIRRVLLREIDGSPRLWATAMVEAKDIFKRLDKKEELPRASNQ